MSDSMVERMAGMIRLCLSNNVTEPEIIAMNVLQIMRDPTDEQRNAYYELSHQTETMVDAHWERAIDAALSEERSPAMSRS
jgi:hypothetical protein